MEFEYEYRREDERFRSTSLWRRLDPPLAFTRSRYGAYVFVPFICLVALVLGGYIAWSGALAGWLCAVAWYWSRNLWTAARIAGDDASPIFGRKVCRIDEKGFHIESAAMKTWHSWTTVRDVAENQKYISIYYDMIRAVVLPKASFRSPEEMAQFLALVRKYAAVSKIGEAPQAPVYDMQRLRLGQGTIVWLAVLVMAMLAMNYGPMAWMGRSYDMVATVGNVVAAENSIAVLGTLRNPGTSDLHVNAIRMNFYDAAGKFIDQCASYTFSLEVKAGAEENFKATCYVGLKQQGGMATASVLASTLKQYKRVEVQAKGFSGLSLSPY